MMIWPMRCDGVAQRPRLYVIRFGARRRRRRKRKRRGRLHRRDMPFWCLSRPLSHLSLIVAREKERHKWISSCSSIPAGDLFFISFLFPASPRHRQGGITQTSSASLPPPPPPSSSSSNNEISLMSLKVLKALGYLHWLCWLDIINKVVTIIAHRTGQSPGSSSSSPVAATIHRPTFVVPSFSVIVAALVVEATKSTERGKESHKRRRRMDERQHQRN